MKPRLILLIVALLAALGCETLEPVRDTAIVRIIDTGIPQEQAFDQAMRWMADSFRSSKTVIEYSDKEAGTINGKASMIVPGEFGIDVRVLFSLVIDLKDSRARLSFRALSVGGITSDAYATSDVIPSVYAGYVKGCDDLVASFQRSLKNPADW